MDQLRDESGSAGGADRGGDGGLPRSSVFIALACSVALAWIPLANLLYPVPLIMIAIRLRRNHLVPIAYAASLAAVLLIIASSVWDRASGSFSVGLFMFSAFIPVSLWIGALAWISLGRFAMKKRFAVSAAFSAASALVFMIWISSNDSWMNDLASQIRLSFETLFPDGAMWLDARRFIEYVFEIAMRSLVPVVVVSLGFSIVVAASMVFKNDMQWQSSAGRWKLNDDFIWVFLVTFFAALISGFLDLPKALNVVLWNLALLSCIAYGIQGYSILLFWIRKRTAVITAHRLAIWLAIGCLLPGVNMAVLAAVPLIGVLETWITMRKPN
ncbi:MAG: hypothetical protein ACTTJZ_07975 [Sphaerochaetaceae bacterium]